MDYIYAMYPRHFLDSLEEEVCVEDGNLRFNVRKNPWEETDRKFVNLFRLSKPVARELITILEPRLPQTRRESEIPIDTRVSSILIDNLT